MAQYSLEERYALGYHKSMGGQLFAIEKLPNTGDLLSSLMVLYDCEIRSILMEQRRMRC